MKSEMDTLLDSLLADWYKWCKHYRFGKGYPSSDVACRQSRTSRQYDDQNGALDGALDDSVMEAFDAAMDRVEQPWRTALSFSAKNMHVRVAVWTSPRLPTDRLELGLLMAQARVKLLRELELNGVIT